MKRLVMMLALIGTFLSLKAVGQAPYFPPTGGWERRTPA